MFEASLFSINPNYYGQPGVHNDAHWIIANILGNFPAVIIQKFYFKRVLRGNDLILHTI